MADDTEEKLIAEMTAIARRLVALGKREGAQETLDRIVKAAGGAPVHVITPARPRERTRLPPDKAGKPSKRRYSYGYVTGALEATFKAHPQGIPRESIDRYIKEVLKKDIDGEALRNGIKQLIRTERVRRDGNMHFWSGQ